MTTCGSRRRTRPPNPPTGADRRRPPDPVCAVSTGEVETAGPLGECGGGAVGTLTRRQVVGAWAAGGTAVAALGLGVGLGLESGRKPHAGGRRARWKLSFDVFGENHAYEEDVSTVDAAAVVAGAT